MMDTLTNCTDLKAKSDRCKGKLQVNPNWCVGFVSFSRSTASERPWQQVGNWVSDECGGSTYSQPPAAAVGVGRPCNECARATHCVCSSAYVCCKVDGHHKSGIPFNTCRQTSTFGPEKIYKNRLCSVLQVACCRPSISYRPPSIPDGSIQMWRARPNLIHLFYWGEGDEATLTGK